MTTAIFRSPTYCPSKSVHHGSLRLRRVWSSCPPTGGSALSETTDSVSTTPRSSQAAKASGDPKTAANWIMSDLLGALKAEGKEIADSPVKPEQLAELLKLIASGELSGKLAKQVFPKMFATGDSAKTIVEREGLKQISDTGAIEKIVDEVIAANPKQVEQYRGGKATVLNFFVGQVMKATRGQAGTDAVTAILKQKLS